ncbi:MAG: hypothetical protein OEM27_09085, partial [Nitrospinota bacterium]|nr:hypothetical protein [Nitrospinota bacterium]
ASYCFNSMATSLLESFMRNTQLYNIKTGNNYQNAISGHSPEGPINQGDIFSKAILGLDLPLEFDYTQYSS